MSKGSLRELGFEAGRNWTVYPKPALILGASGVMVAAGVSGITGLTGWDWAWPTLAVVAVVVALACCPTRDGKGKLGKPAFVAGVIGGALVAGGLLDETHRPMIGWGAAAFCLLVLILGTVVWILRDVADAGTTEATLRRRERQRQESGNTASRMDVWELASKQAMRRAAGVVRPSLRALSPRELRKLPVSEYGVLLMRKGFGILPWHRIYGSYEQFTVMFGGPRIGKTMLLANIALDAPGFLITTSTRSDLAEWVHAKRSKAHGWKPTAQWWWARLLGWVRHRSPLEFVDGFGRDVHVWNPTKSVGLRNTAHWRVLDGCEDYETAQRRAGDFIIDDPGAGEGRRWDSDARPLLAIYMHLAAISGRTMWDVLVWNGDLPPAEKTTCRSRTQMEQALEKNPNEADRRIINASLAAHYSRPDKTRGSVTHTVGQALHWLGSAKAREMGDCPRDKQTLDIRRAILNGETIHVLGADRQPELAPLNRAFMNEVAEQIRLIADGMEDQRLDPPGKGCFDEAGLVARIPLHDWSADMGGRGFCITASFQSLSQMRATLGADCANTTMGNANNLVYFGGGNSPDDLVEVASMVGKARYKNEGEKQESSDSHHWGETIDAAGIRSLRKGEALLLRQELKPVVGKTPQIWRVKGAKRTPVRSVLEEAVAEEIVTDDELPVDPTAVVPVQASEEVH